MSPERRLTALASSLRGGRGEEFWTPTRAALSEVGAELRLEPYRTFDELLPLAKEADAIYQGPVPMSRELLSQLPNLRTICALGIGFDDFDVEAATELGIVVINLPRVFHREVAQHTMALLLSQVRQIVPLNAAMHARPSNPTASLHPVTPKQHIYGQTLGLIAFGNIAREVAKLAKAFELRVITYDPFVKPDLAREHGVESVDLEQLLRESDYISMHTPLSKATYHLMGEEQFRLMKPTAFFINTSRGKTVDETALLKALREGWIAGAALDVTEIEPPEPTNPLLTLDNVILTPHIASASDKARHERARWMGIEVGRIFSGQWPLNGLVNKSVKPRFPLA